MADGGGGALGFVFPGTGVRPCGHEVAFAERHAAIVRPVLDEVSAHAGADLRAALAGGDGLTELQGQLATYAFDVAVARVYLAHGLRPALSAGHSMGLYGALAAAGAIGLADGSRVVEAAYRAVEAAVAGRDASMAVVVGLGAGELDDVLARRPAGCTARRVNANNDTTFVLAGLRADLLATVEAAAGRGALKARLLPVGAPYHHPALLAGASAALSGFLRGLEWAPARWPIVSTIDRRRLTSPDDLVDLTARNLSTPIDWAAAVGEMIAAGTVRFFECGAGVSLAQNGRLVEGCPPFVTVKNALRRVGV